MFLIFLSLLLLEMYIEGGGKTNTTRLIVGQWLGGSGLENWVWSIGIAGTGYCLRRLEGGFLMIWTRAVMVSRISRAMMAEMWRGLSEGDRECAVCDRLVTAVVRCCRNTVSCTEISCCESRPAESSESRRRWLPATNWLMRAM